MHSAFSCRCRFDPFDILNALYHLRNDEIGSSIGASGVAIRKFFGPGIQFDGQGAEHAADHRVIALDHRFKLAEPLGVEVIPHLRTTVFEQCESAIDDSLELGECGLHLRTATGHT